jgi:glycosidase
MPDLNHANDDVTAQMDDVARFWLEQMGVDGFRLDAVRHLIEDGDITAGASATHAWLKAWDDRLDAIDREAFTVGEVWDETSEVAPYVTGDEIDIAFDFTLAGALLNSVNVADPGPFDQALADVLSAYPPGQFAPFLTNHDQNRVMSQLGGDLAKAKLAASALLTLPGVPFLYYGEEIGMVGEKPDEMIRTPMQWADTTGAGFTTGTPWEPINDDYPTVNVATQQKSPDSLLTRYRTLLGIRAGHPALSRGGLASLASTCPEVYGYARATADQDDQVLVVLNFAETEQRGCSFSAPSTGLAPGTSRAQDLLGATTARALEVGDSGAIAAYVPVESIPARGALVLEVSQ